MTYDVAIIGAGIVGTATAFKLLERQPELKICLIEKEEGIARHQSGRNSGVIHSGIYYKPGSLKALNCRKGYADLIQFCDTHGVRYELCGKIIAATDKKEEAQLHAIFERGTANGLKGLRIISREEAQEIEPHVHCTSAIWVPQTGIINYREVAEKQCELAQSQGAETFFGRKVTALRRAPGEIVIETTGGELHARTIINCAGLYSDKIAAMDGSSEGLQIIPFRGEYYELNPEREHLVRSLIYPVPNPAFPFLGVHFTRMIEGGVEAGPNAVLAFKREGYRLRDVHLRELLEILAFPGMHRIAAKYWRIELGELKRSFSKRAFVRALQHLMPEIRESDLHPGRAGVRAMACDRKGNLIDDFLIRRSQGMVHVLNAPSPAATASLAIGGKIVEEWEKA